MFQQVPLVEIDGMQLVQTKAILNYIAGKYNLYGKDLRERAMIDMYVEGIGDIMDMFLPLFFIAPDAKQKQLDNIESKSKGRLLPVFEKALANSQFLVGNQLSRADVLLLEITLMLQEFFPTILSTFPKIQEFQRRIKALPNISKFLQPGSARKPVPDEAYVKTVMEVLSHLFNKFLLILGFQIMTVNNMADPRRPNKIFRYKPPNTESNPTLEDPTPDYMNLLGMIFSMCGLMLKLKWCAWIAVYCSFISFANSRSSEDTKQMMSSFMLSISAVVMSYLQNPQPMSPPW